MIFLIEKFEKKKELQENLRDEGKIEVFSFIINCKIKINGLLLMWPNHLKKNVKRTVK